MGYSTDFGLLERCYEQYNGYNCRENQWKELQNI